MMVDWIICFCLLFIGGVVQVIVLGGDIKEYQILFDLGKMKYYGIGLNEVIDVVKDMNQNVVGGVLYEFGNEFIVCGVLFINKVEVFCKVVIKNVDEVFIILENIVEVKIGVKVFKMGLVFECGKVGILLIVIK